jgi:homoserine O-acetyltransferase
MLGRTALIHRATILALLFRGGIALAHGPDQPAHQRFEEGDLKLESGEVIKDFAISFVTHGTLNENKNNAILMTSSIGGNHHRIDFLIGPGKALDTNKYFIIATDAIGNGLSTSPSNSKSQHGTLFPHFTIRDMVESQYRLLKEKFGITRLRAVSGASMGGMQSLQWGVSHPEMMDALIALTPMARTPAWSIAVNEATRKALTADSAYNNGDYTQQPEKGWRAWVDVLLTLATRTPDGLKAEFPNGLDAIGWIKNFEDSWAKSGFDANNWIWQTWAYDRHDVGTNARLHWRHCQCAREH